VLICGKMYHLISFFESSPLSSAHSVVKKSSHA